MDLERKSIERIRLASDMSLSYYKKPLVCTYSGGKDSDVMLELFKRSGVLFEVHNSHTTADAPQTVRHIRDVFRDLELHGIKCNIDYHEKPDGSRTTMWNLIEKQGVPTRRMRFCCKYLKEEGGRNRMIATGVRWAESAARARRTTYETVTAKKEERVFVSDEKMLLTDNEDTRRLFESCQMKAKTVVNPIIDWSDGDIWDFYRNECNSHNELYKMGYYRVGCIGCPMAGKRRWKEFGDFPKYKQMYIHSFDRMLKRRKKPTNWKSGEEVFMWWMEEDPNQIKIDDYMSMINEEL